MDRHRLLLIEDSLQYRSMIEASLKTDFEVLTATTRAEGLAMLNGQFDVILIDVGLPDGDGFEICKTIRMSGSNATVPIIFVTSRDSDEDLVEAYTIGADDYLKKPFNVEVLRALALSKIRRLGDKQEILSYGDIRVVTRSRRALCHEQEVRLTKTEYDLLQLFLKNIDVVLSREKILDLIWGNSKNVIDRTVDVHLNNLRKKLPTFAEGLESIHGLGYRLRVSSADKKLA